MNHNHIYDEDEQLSMAIALSLQDQNQPTETIEIEDSDSDDESVAAKMAFKSELKQAVAQSRSALLSSNEAQASTARATPPSTFLNERAQMERERRERQRQRQQQSGTIANFDTARKKRDLESDVDDQEDNDSVDSRQSKRSRRSSPYRSQQPTSSLKPEDERFWTGAYRPIANSFAFPRKDGKTVFRLTELIGKKEDVHFAIISSFCVDTPWIYQFFDRNTPVIFINPPDGNGNASIRNILPNWIKTTPFLRNGRGCMHVKLLLLFYADGRLRIVVPTANLIAFDWKEIDNFAWVQDVPLRSRPIPRDPKAKEDFASMLQFVLHSLNVKPALENMIKFERPNLCLRSIDELRTRWDFSKVKAHLVASIAGKHEGWPNVKLTGHPRLMSAIINMGFKGRKLALECQGSSLGTYTTQWLNEFYDSAIGKSAESWLDKPRKRRESLPLPDVKVLFPTKRTVQQTTAQDLGATNLFYRRNQWESRNCPRKLFHDSKATGGPTVMHTKMILALFKEPSSSSSSQSRSGKTGKQKVNGDQDDSDSDIEIVDPNAGAIGWVYIGSHNFTPSAWGHIGGSAFNPALNLTNYELGVVFPLFSEQDVDKVQVWERPPTRYGANDEPWFQEESYIVKAAYAAQENLMRG